MSRLAIVRRRFAGVAHSIRRSNLWRRVLKYTVATMVTVVISVIPAVVSIFGPAAFLAPLTTVFGHPGQRLGLMVESLMLIITGTLLGVGWSTLGLYLSSLVYHQNIAGAYTVRAIFLAVATVFHGFLRSQTPRLFVFVLFLLIVSVITLLGTASAVTTTTVTQMLYPILSAVAILLVINIALFPEFSSSFLGSTTIDTLTQTAGALRDAAEFFTAERDDNESIGIDDRSLLSKAEENTHRGGLLRKPQGQPRAAVDQHSSKLLATLTDSPAKLRSQLRSCKSAQEECMFEVSYAALPPRSLREISCTAMTGLVQNAVALVSACQSKYSLEGQPEVGHQVASGSGHNHHKYVEKGGSQKGPGSEGVQLAAAVTGNITKQRGQSSLSPTEKVEHVRPHREIESGDADLLESLLAQVRGPVREFQQHIGAAVDLVITCLAYCYNVPRLPSGCPTPKGIRMEEIDIRVNLFRAAISKFDQSSVEALGKAASMDGRDSIQADIMPRGETFLISSFLLSLRQGAIHAMQMLKHVRSLVEKRQARHDHRRLYLPRKIKWRKFLASGGEQDGMTLPENARRDARLGKGLVDVVKAAKAGENSSESTSTPERRDEESGMARPANETLPRSSPQPRPREGEQKRSHKREEIKVLRVRASAAGAIESCFHSEDLSYALKLATAVFLVSFPGFMPSANSWYAAARGVWAPLQLILVFEVAIGTSFFVFIVRAAGVVFGCLVGYLAYVIGRGNLIALVFILILGIFPSAYVQLGTPYVKAGMISVVSMTVVALATVNRSGSAEENFAKRLGAFIIGGTVALLVEVVLYPVKARERLVESLSSCLTQITHMQTAVAAGVDGPVKVDLRSPKLHSRFSRAKEKAQTALSAAETFLPFCLSEPRLKGSFRALEPIYKEIIYVLHQIIDRMDNVVQLRRAYGSSVLEDLNPHVYAYRRNVAASVTLTLFAVNEALTMRMPLPQFLPSSRLAQLRLVHRVREVLAEKSLLSKDHRRRDIVPARRADPASVTLDELTIRNVTDQKFLSWNAAAAGQMAIIEYLEELVDLAKLLVGVNAFRSGMLERPSYQAYAQRTKTREISVAGLGKADEEGVHEKKEEERKEEMAAAAVVPSDPARSRTERFRGMLADRSPLGTSGGAAARHVRDDLPPSLRRVGTRVRQERNIIRSMTVFEGKGKGVDKSSRR